MIVDDDEDDREFFEEAVDKINSSIKCMNLENGEKALQYLKDESKIMPDYIFLDLNMPKINGKECLIEIKKTHHLKEIPVIIYTTSNQEKDREQTKQLGAIGFIHKHTQFDMLCDELRGWLA
jgi:CheY-like chemotaxis protein